MDDEAVFGATVSDYSGTIPRLLERAVRRDPARTWIRTDDVELSFAQAGARVADAVNELSLAGIGTGDLVMVTARTTPDYLLTWLALAHLGAVTVPVNPASSAAELTGLIRQVEPVAIVTDAELGPAISAAIGAAQEAGGRPVRVTLRISDLFSDQPGRQLADLPPSSAGPGDLAVLIPTSGTTGRSKLVAQTHRAYAMAGEGFPFWMGLDASDRLMTSLPLFHINAPIYSVLGALACGAGLVLLPRFSASGFIDAARRHGATEFNAIGAMLEILMRQPPRPDDADTPLRLCYTGPAPERGRHLEIERRFGIRIVVGYAMSESPYGLIWARGSRPYGTLGSVRQHPVLGNVNEARVVSADGRVLGPGETGEIELRNPVLTPGYRGMPQETAALFDDGWLRTGDLVTG